MTEVIIIIMESELSASVCSVMTDLYNYHYYNNNYTKIIIMFLITGRWLDLIGFTVLNFVHTNIMWSCIAIFFMYTGIIINIIT